MTIPAGTAVLVPIINFTTSFNEEPDIETEDELLRRAKSDIDDIVTKHASLNGNSIEPLEPFRVRSDVFDVRILNDNVFGVFPWHDKRCFGTGILVVPKGFESGQL